jgi:hypothetical protein
MGYSVSLSYGVEDPQVRLRPDYTIPLQTGVISLVQIVFYWDLFRGFISDWYQTH